MIKKKKKTNSSTQKTKDHTKELQSNEYLGDTLTNIIHECKRHRLKEWIPYHDVAISQSK